MDIYLYLVLYQFGYLIGEWKVNLAPHGGYFSVKVHVLYYIHCNYLD